MLHIRDNLRLLNLDTYPKTDREFPNGGEILSAHFYQLLVPASHLRTRSRLSLYYAVINGAFRIAMVVSAHLEH